MGVPTVTAARILKGQLNGQSGEETQLEMDKFPFLSLAKVVICGHCIIQYKGEGGGAIDLTVAINGPLKSPRALNKASQWVMSQWRFYYPPEMWKTLGRQKRIV